MSPAVAALAAFLALWLVIGAVGRYWPRRRRTRLYRWSEVRIFVGGVEVCVLPYVDCDYHVACTGCGSTSRLP